MNLVKQKPHLHTNWIDSQALDVVVKLQNAGFETYFVGGCVRDLLVGLNPKDYDIATSASPQQVKKKISFSFIIGKRFRLVLVKRGDKQFEVATFRRNINEEDVEFTDEDHFGDNFFGTTEEDAKRRDFTVNGLFYDPIKNEIIDFIDGLKDIENKILRMIGEPDVRLKEDPIRILRAIRLAHKLNFTIEESLRKSISENADALAKTVLPRRREEYLKIMRHSENSRVWLKLFDLNLLATSVPYLHEILLNPVRSEVFCKYVNLSPSYAGTMADPIKEFTILILAVIRALDQTPEQWFSSDKSSYFLQQIGIFKQEASIIQRTLHFLKYLADAPYYRQKGQRRQQAFIKQEVFDSALQIAELEYAIPPNEILFWKNEQLKYIASKTEKTDIEEEQEASAQDDGLKT